MPYTTLPTPDIEFDQKGLNFTGSPPGGLVTSYTNTGLGSTQYDANLVDGTAANLTVQIRAGKVFAQPNTNVGLRLNNPKASFPQPYTIMMIGNEFFRDGDQVYWMDDVANNVNIRSDITNYNGWAGAGPLSNNAAIGLDDAIIIFTVDGANSSIRVVGDGIDQTISGNAGANVFDLEMLYWNKDKTANLSFDGQINLTRAWRSKFTQVQSDKAIGDEAFSWGIPGVGVLLTAIDGTAEGGASIIDGGGLDGLTTLRYKLADNSRIVNQVVNKGERVFLHNFNGENGQAIFDRDETGKLAITTISNVQNSSSDPKFGSGSIVRTSISNQFKTASSAIAFVGDKDFRLHGWTKADGISNIFQIYDGVSDGEGVYFFHDIDGSNSFFTIFINDSSGTFLSLSTPSIYLENQWYEFSFVKNGLDVDLYIDGNSVLSQTLTSQPNFTAVDWVVRAYIGQGSMDSLSCDIGRAIDTANYTARTKATEILYADVDTVLDSGFSEALDTGNPTDGVPMLTSINADTFSAWSTRLEGLDAANDGTDIGFSMLPRAGYVGLQAMTTGADAANVTPGQSVYASDIITVEDNTQCFVEQAGITFNANGTIAANPNGMPVQVNAVYWLPSTKQYTATTLVVDGTAITEGTIDTALTSTFSLANKVGI